jgi:hypothetical protein
MPAHRAVKPGVPSAEPTATLPAARGQTDPAFWVLARSLPELRRRIERLGRRAEQLGIGPLMLRDTGRRDGERACVVLEGEPPTLAGWTLVAVVDHRGPEPALRVVTADAPGLDRPRFAEPRCDHCHLRRRRAQTFVVRHAATRRLRQVGSGCLRDFLDGHDPERLCRHADYLLLAHSELRAADRHDRADDAAERGVSLREFAAHAAHVLRLQGWVSRQQARESGRTATADAAHSSLERTPNAPDASARVLADAALGWARELLAAREQLSDFERDAIAVANVDTLLTARERGLICALIAVYRRRRARSRHLGHPGDWLDSVVLVERVADARSRRRGAPMQRHDLIDIDGNRLVWWDTSGAQLPLGQAIHLRARVERHARFGRAAVTVLACCRTLDRRQS